MDETSQNTPSGINASQYASWTLKGAMDTNDSATSWRLKVAASNTVGRDRTWMDKRRRAILKRAVSKKIPY